MNTSQTSGQLVANMRNKMTDSERKPSGIWRFAIIGLLACGVGILAPNVAYFGTQTLLSSLPVGASDIVNQENTVNRNASPATEESTVGSALDEELISEPIVTEPNPADLASAYAWAVRNKLEELGLGSFVNVTIHEDGSLGASGKFSKRLQPAYQTFLAWYETRKTFPPLKQNVQEVAETDLLPQIRSVWLGAIPTVHLDNGEIARVGSKLGDGWLVVAIDTTSVRLERDGETLSLSY